MEGPQPRTTEIIASKMIEGLFYEKLKQADDKDIFLSVYYKGEQYFLHEFVEFGDDPDIKGCIGECTVGEIKEIDPEGEQDGEENTVMVIEFGKNKVVAFHISSIRKVRPTTIWE